MASASQELLSSPVEAAVPMYRGNAARTGEHPGPGPIAPLRSLWHIRLGTKITSSPAVISGVIFVGSAAPITMVGGALHAVDAATGAELWRLQTATGDAIFSSPAVQDNVVCAGSYDGIFVAADARTGVELWRFQAEGAIYSSPVFDKHLIYVGDDAGRLYALDSATGLEHWRFGEDKPYRRSINASAAIVNELVYVIDYGWHVDEPSVLHALSGNSGVERWQFSAPEGGKVSGTVACAGGQVYVVTDHGFLYTLDQTDGRELWRFDEAGEFRPLIAVSEGIVLLGISGGRLLALDSDTGGLAWMTQIQAGAELASALVIAQQTIYAGDSDGRLHAIGLETGDVRWSANVGTLASSLAVIDGAIYAGTDGGILGALIGDDGQERQEGDGYLGR